MKIMAPKETFKSVWSLNGEFLTSTWHLLPLIYLIFTCVDSDPQHWSRLTFFFVLLKWGSPFFLKILQYCSATLPVTQVFPLRNSAFEPGTTSLAERSSANEPRHPLINAFILFFVVGSGNGVSLVKLATDLNER